VFPTPYTKPNILQPDPTKSQKQTFHPAIHHASNHSYPSTHPPIRYTTSLFLSTDLASNYPSQPFLQPPSLHHRAQHSPGSARASRTAIIRIRALVQSTLPVWDSNMRTRCLALWVQMVRSTMCRIAGPIQPPAGAIIRRCLGVCPIVWGCTVERSVGGILFCYS